MTLTFWATDPRFVKVELEDLIRQQVTEPLLYIADLLRVQMGGAPVHEQSRHESSSRCAGAVTPTGRSVEVAADSAAGPAGGPLASGRSAAESENLPDPGDVAALTALLDLMADFPSNEQRARYLLSSNWMRERGAAAAQRNADALERIAR